MGANTSVALQPEELVAFKKLPSNVSLNSIRIPEDTENRRPTDAKWLIGLGVAVLVLLPFLIYAFVNSDIERNIIGYDECGNVCGKKNSEYSGIPCSGADKTLQPYLESESGFSILEHRRCVSSCNNGYEEIFGQCIKGNALDKLRKSMDDDYSSSSIGELNFAIYFNSIKWQIVISCLISILISIGMLFAFRHATSCLVWTILIVCYSALVILVIGLWILCYSVEEEAQTGVLFGAGFTTFVVLILGAILVCFRHKIALVILLLKEATKAVFDMPHIITVPVVSFLVIFILVICFVLATLGIVSSGTLKHLIYDYYYFEFTGVLKFTAYFNAVIFIWLTQFIVGIQYMVIAGAVSQWYFTRDKSNLREPVSIALKNTFRFHLGTIAMGSWIIMLVKVLKNLILSLFKNESVRAIVKFLLDPLERLIQFLSKNAYIMTAIHGQAFLSSGRRAARIIFDNLGNVVAINSIGDFVLGMAQVLIAIITVVISIGIFAIAPSAYPNSTNIFAYGIIFIVALISGAVTFAVFETAIDTLLICYCEDRLLNDGQNKPFFMSRNLMEFVEDSKKIYNKK